MRRGDDGERMVWGLSKIVGVREEMRVKMKVDVGVCIEEMEEIFGGRVVEIEGVDVVWRGLREGLKSWEVWGYE